MNYGTLRVGGRDLDVTALRLVGGQLEVTARGFGPLHDPGDADLIGDDGRLVFRVAPLTMSDDEREQVTALDEPVYSVTVVLPIGLLQPDRPGAVQSAGGPGARSV